MKDKKYRDKNKSQPKKIAMNLKLWAVVLLVIIALGAGAYLIYTQTALREADRAVTGGVPKISITPAVRNLGDVSASKGTVSTLFAIGNEGDGDLVIRDMETSCMCTEAALVIGDREGPRFGMRGHGQRPVGWSATLKPGEQATLKVYYDPTVHGDLRGPITRLVRVYSNDPTQSYVDVRIELNQVP